MLNPKKELLSIAFFLFAFSYAFSQKDSLFYVKYNDNFNSLNDTIFSNEFNIDNVFYKYQSPFTYNFNLGNFSSANYSPLIHNLNTNYTVNENFYSFRGNEKNYFFTSKPLTILKYVNGRRREQLFNLFHTNNITKHWNITLSYDRFFTTGFYLNQLTKGSSFKVSSILFSKKFILRFNYFQNKGNQQENGGIANVSDFEDNILLNRKTINVNLNNAENTYLNKDASLNATYYFSNESFSGIYLKPEIVYQLNIKKFTDDNPVSGFFDNVFIDSVQTKDSILQYKISPVVSVGFKNEFLDANVYYKHQFEKYSQNYFIAIDTLNTYAGSNFSFNINKFYSFNKMEYSLLGYRKNDIFFSSSNTYINNHDTITLTANYSNLAPNYHVKYYYSNNFNWSYEFNKVEQLFFDFKFKWHKLPIALKTSSKFVKQYIFYDEKSRPKQFSEYINANSISLTSKLKWKNIFFNTWLTYQYISDKNIIPLPDFLARQMIYYQFKLFKKKVLTAKFGVDMFYYTEHYGYNYQPALGVFYLQHNNLTGNYPYADIFLEATIKRAKLFIKYEHINAGLLDYNYYTTYGYPMGDRALRLGLNWILWN